MGLDKECAKELCLPNILRKKLRPCVQFIITLKEYK